MCGTAIPLQCNSDMLDLSYLDMIRMMHFSYVIKIMHYEFEIHLTNSKLHQGRGSDNVLHVSVCSGINSALSVVFVF